MKNNKIISLELLRFFSSLLVVVWHYMHFFYPFNSISPLNIFEYNNEFLKLFFKSQLGTHGVYIFFCISGIVFSANYLNKVTSFRNFFIRRFARLYPLHFFTLIFVALIQIINLKYIGNFEIYFFNDLKHFFLNIYLISGWGFEDGYSFNAPIWSVSVEIIVYFVFFNLIAILSRKNFLIIISLIILFVFIKKTYFDNEIFSAFVLFFSGVLLFKIYSEKKILLLFFITFFLLSLNLFGNYEIILTCIGICAFFLSINNIFSNLSLQKVSQSLGDLTYSSYLLHIPLQLTLIFIINQLNINQNIFKSPYFFLIFIILVYLISLLVFRFYEKPVGYFIRKKYLN